MTQLVKKESKEKSEIETLNAEIERLRKALCDTHLTVPKHLLMVPHDATLNEEQYQRLRTQCVENFGEGKFLILEGGLRYMGLTHTMAVAGGER